MDIITQRFIAISNKLVAELRLLRNGIEKIVGAVHDAEKAQNQEHQQQPPIVRAELQIPEAIEREREKRDDRHYRLQKWLTVGTWLAFAAAAIYAGIAAAQWRTMNKTYGEIRMQTIAASEAAGAAKSAAVTADNSLKQAFRPRIALTSPRASITDGKLSLGLQAVNYGTTSARNIVWQQATELGVPEKLYRLRYKPSKGILETSYPKEIPPGNVVTSPSPIDLGFYADKNLLQQQIDELVSEKVWATFSVLVTYEDDFGLTHHAETCVQSCGKAGGMRWRYCPWSARND